MEKNFLDLNGVASSIPPEGWRSKVYPPDLEWTWDKSLTNDFVDLLNDDRDVKFHRNFSSGTAVVRGTQPMLHDQHFWEVEMISRVYGTDMMIGVGTPEADVSQVHDRFISFLGMNNQTWGLSYTGVFHHNGESRDFSSRFGQGSIIGVHLDMWNGTLSYYKNKKHLGIASRGLKGKTLYAMASSTAACSGMRIVSSSSFPSSLQYLCCARLRALVPDDKNVIAELPLPPGLRLFLENNLSWLLDCRSAESLGHICIPVPKRRRWVYESDPDSGTMLRGVFYQEASEVEMDSSQFITSVLILKDKPVLLCDFHRSQRSSAGATGESHRNCVAGHEETEPNSLIDATEELDKSLVESLSSDDLTDSEESDAKRRRCSYNYLVGLSDPDSD